MRWASPAVMPSAGSHRAWPAIRTLRFQGETLKPADWTDWPGQ